jgi:hypothetical protein
VQAAAVQVLAVLFEAPRASNAFCGKFLQARRTAFCLLADRIHPEHRTEQCAYMGAKSMMMM